MMNSFTSSTCPSLWRATIRRLWTFWKETVSTSVTQKVPMLPLTNSGTLNLLWQSKTTEVNNFFGKRMASRPIPVKRLFDYALFSDSQPSTQSDVPLWGFSCCLFDWFGRLQVVTREVQRLRSLTLPELFERNPFKMGNVSDFTPLASSSH